MIVQMVWVTQEVALFIYGFNDKNEMVFRSSAMPKYLQNEPIVIDNNMVHTNLYHFSIHFLRHFITN